jgi:shikimate dehydrogenase
VTTDGQTQLVGIIGWPVAHSLSPEMHNAAFAYMNLNWRYVPLPVRPEDLPNALKGLNALGFRGVNVTVPHKVNVIPLLDHVSEAAQIVGAVNTIRIERSSGKLEGLNTDMTGFLADLAANKIALGKGARVVVLGAGGAARAVGAGLSRSGGHVTFVNRTVEKAETIVQFLKSSWSSADVQAAPFDALAEVSRNATLIINATPVGMWPEVDSTPWPEGVPFPKEATIYDTVYRPIQTRLMRDAEAAGLRAVGGLGMLVYQGVAALEVWTGRQPPIDVMKMMCLHKLTET